MNAGTKASAAFNFLLRAVRGRGFTCGLPAHPFTTKEEEVYPLKRHRHSSYREQRLAAERLERAFARAEAEMTGHHAGSNHNNHATGLEPASNQALRREP